MDEDEELENVLADIEDVAAGRIIDMAHADLMMPLTEACTDLESELETFYRTSVRNAIINRMTVDELNKLIESLKSTTDFIRKLKSAVD